MWISSNSKIISTCIMNTKVVGLIEFFLSIKIYFYTIRC